MICNKTGPKTVYIDVSSPIVCFFKVSVPSRRRMYQY